MDRKLYKDNFQDISQKLPPIHTFTAESHENLLKNHLELDAARQKRLQNDLREIKDENDRLQKVLENALHDIQNKEARLGALNNELRNKIQAELIQNQQPDAQRYSDLSPERRDKLLKHFNVITQRHYDLLAEKDRRIADLKQHLMSQPPMSSTRDVDIQVSGPNIEEMLNKLKDEFTNQVAQIEKECDQVEQILKDRNKNLEKLIDDLQSRLNDYSQEIQHLKHDIASKKNQPPSESTLRLIKEKDMENVQLKVLIPTLENQLDKALKCDKLADEVRKIINKKEAIQEEINHLVEKMNKELPAKRDLTGIEEECQDLKSQLNTIRDKMNFILTNLKSIQSEATDKNEIVQRLKNIKNKYENESTLLEEQLNRLQKEITPQKPVSAQNMEPSMSVLSTRAPTVKTINSYRGPEKVISFVDLEKKSMPRERYHHPRYSACSDVIPRQCEACNNIKQRPQPVSPPQPTVSPVPLIQRVQLPSVPLQPSVRTQPSVHTQPSAKSLQSMMSSRKIAMTPPPRTSPNINNPVNTKKKKKGGCCGQRESESSNFTYQKKEQDFPRERGGKNKPVDDTRRKDLLCNNKCSIVEDRKVEYSVNEFERNNQLGTLLFTEERRKEALLLESIKNKVGSYCNSKEEKKSLEAQNDINRANKLKYHQIEETINMRHQGLNLNLSCYREEETRPKSVYETIWNEGFCHPYHTENNIKLKSLYKSSRQVNHNNHNTTEEKKREILISRVERETYPVAPSFRKERKRQILEFRTDKEETECYRDKRKIKEENSEIKRAVQSDNPITQQIPICTTGREKGLGYHYQKDKITNSELIYDSIIRREERPGPPWKATDKWKYEVPTKETSSEESSCLEYAVKKKTPEPVYCIRKEETFDHPNSTYEMKNPEPVYPEPLYPEPVYPEPVYTDSKEFYQQNSVEVLTEWMNNFSKDEFNRENPTQSYLTEETKTKETGTVYAPVRENKCSGKTTDVTIFDETKREERRLLNSRQHYYTQDESTSEQSKAKEKKLCSLRAREQSIQLPLLQQHVEEDILSYFPNCKNKELIKSYQSQTKKTDDPGNIHNKDETKLGRSMNMRGKKGNSSVSEARAEIIERNLSYKLARENKPDYSEEKKLQSIKQQCKMEEVFDSPNAKEKKANQALVNDMFEAGKYGHPPAIEERKEPMELRSRNDERKDKPENSFSEDEKQTLVPTNDIANLETPAHTLLKSLFIDKSISKLLREANKIKVLCNDFSRKEMIFLILRRKTAEEECNFSFLLNTFGRKEEPPFDEKEEMKYMYTALKPEPFVRPLSKEETIYSVKDERILDSKLLTYTINCPLPCNEARIEENLSCSTIKEGRSSHTYSEDCWTNFGIIGNYNQSCSNKIISEAEIKDSFSSCSSRESEKESTQNVEIKAVPISSDQGISKSLKNKNGKGTDSSDQYVKEVLHNFIYLTTKDYKYHDDCIEIRNIPEDSSVTESPRIFCYENDKVDLKTSLSQSVEEEASNSLIKRDKNIHLDKPYNVDDENDLKYTEVQNQEEDTAENFNIYSSLSIDGDQIAMSEQVWGKPRFKKTKGALVPKIFQTLIDRITLKKK